MGSSTCVLASIDPEAPYLYTANLGDSGFILLRKEGLDLVTVYESKPQQHQFNFPFQVGTSGDDPAKAEEKTIQVEHNDLLVMATDGMFDNIFSRDVVDIIRPSLRDTDNLIDPESISELIATFAEKKSLDPRYISPFAKEANRHFYDAIGGKPDDITVVVSQIKLRKGQVKA